MLPSFKSTTTTTKLTVSSNQCWTFFFSFLFKYKNHVRENLVIIFMPGVKHRPLNENELKKKNQPKTLYYIIKINPLAYVCYGKCKINR